MNTLSPEQRSIARSALAAPIVRTATAGEHQPVGHVDPQEGERRRELAFVEALLLRQRRVARPDGEAPGASAPRLHCPEWW